MMSWQWMAAVTVSHSTSCGKVLVGYHLDFW